MDSNDEFILGNNERFTQNVLDHPLLPGKKYNFIIDQNETQNSFENPFPSSDNNLESNLYVELQVWNKYEKEANNDHGMNAKDENEAECNTKNETHEEHEEEISNDDFLQDIESDVRDCSFEILASQEKVNGPEREAACGSDIVDRRDSLPDPVENLFLQMIVKDVLGVEGSGSYCSSENEEDVFHAQEIKDIEDKAVEILFHEVRSISFNQNRYDNVNDTFENIENEVAKEVNTKLSTSSTFENPIYNPEIDELDENDLLNIFSCFKKCCEEEEIPLDFYSKLCNKCKAFYDAYIAHYANNEPDEVSFLSEHKTQLEEFVNISYEFNFSTESEAVENYCSLWTLLNHEKSTCLLKAAEDLHHLLQRVHISKSNVIVEEDHVSDINEKAVTDILRRRKVKLNEEVTIPEKYQCSICLDLLYEPYVTPCFHIFCVTCLRQLNQISQRKPLCPLCRQKIMYVQPCTALGDEINKFNPELYKMRSDAIKDTSLFPLPSPTSVRFPHENDINDRTAIQQLHYFFRTCFMLMFILISCLSNVNAGTIDWDSTITRLLRRFCYVLVILIFIFTVFSLLYLLLYHIYLFMGCILITSFVYFVIIKVYLLIRFAI